MKSKYLVLLSAMAESASLDVKVAAIRLRLEKAKAAIDRFERDGVLSSQAAEVERREIKASFDIIEILAPKKAELNRHLRAAEKKLKATKEQESCMNKAEIFLKLREEADFHLLGAGTWPSDRESIAAFQKAKKELGLEEDVPGSPGHTRSTALGRELNVDLMTVFAGAFHVFDVPEILESRGYIEPAETRALISLESEAEAEKLVREHVLRAYLKFCNHSHLMN